MQEEVTEKVVAIAFRASKFTASSLYKAVKKYVEHQKQLESRIRAKRAEKKKEMGISSAKHGRMKVKQLMGQNAGASSIEIGHDINVFEKVARKYNVDFAVKKDKTVDPPKYITFFKARDADAISQAFKEYVYRCEKTKDRESLKKRLDKSQDIARKKAEKNIAHEKHKEQERSL